MSKPTPHGDKLTAAQANPKSVLQAGPPPGHEFEFDSDGLLRLGFSRHFGWGVWAHLKGGSQSLLLLRLVEKDGDYHFLATRDTSDLERW